MVRSRSGRRSRSCRLALGALLLVPGCASLFSSSKDAEYDPRMPPVPLGAAPPPMIGARADASSDEATGIRTVGYQEPAQMPGRVLPPALPAAHEVSVSLEFVLRTTDAQNAQIALARKRVEEAQAAECNAPGPLAKALHHASVEGDDGGSPGGSRYAADARTWQRRVELARTLNETLLDAGNTYYDLLTARRGEIIGQQLQKYQDSLLHRAEDLAKTDRSAAVLVESLRADSAGRHAVQAKLHQQGDAAAAKLAYLLNLPPEIVVVPQDASLVPIDLVDASVPADALIEEALSNGPGVRELSGLIATIEAGINSVPPCLARLPNVSRQLQRAGFKLQEAHLALEDVRGKLAAAVLEARGAILSGRDQVRDSADNIRHAAETYRLSDLRLRENAPGASSNDVSQSIRGLELAHFTHLAAVAAYDKAQLRLFLLLGRWDSQAVCPLVHP